MATIYAFPKNGAKCVFCKFWTGDAKLVPVSKQRGYQFESGVMGKCLQGNSNQPSTGGVNCRKYMQSPEASKLP